MEATTSTTQQQVDATTRSSASSSTSSPSNSISLLKLDELSSFGATKKNRLPVLIKMNQVDSQQAQANSMPAFSAEQLEQNRALDRQQSSLPIPVASSPGDKENLDDESMNATDCREQAETSDDFQVVEMVGGDVAMMGPSLPPPKGSAEATSGDKSLQEASGAASSGNNKLPGDLEQQFQRQVLTSMSANNQYPSHLGDSLIEMIINLRNDNQNLVKALETNNEYVKERLGEFKRIQEETKKREAQFALEKAEFEHQNRKLTRQNLVLSERLKSMEAKLKDLKLEVSESLVAAQSSKASSLRGDGDHLYPQLAESESFTNSALNQATTMQIDAASGELMQHDANNEEESSGSETEESDSEDSGESPRPSAPAMDTEGPSDAVRLGQMSKEELSKRFDANKAQFYAMDDPMKQCDQLEKQLNDIGKRDYEICLLQQQLNIYRQDFRLERMAKLEAKIQIEKLKNDIDKLCLERIQASESREGAHQAHGHHRHHRRHRLSGRLDPAVAAAEAVIGKLGHQLSKRAAKSAAKAAKYAAKQAHKEEKAAVYAAAKVAAAEAHAANYRQQQQHQPMEASSSGEQQPDQYGHHHGHRRHHSHHHHHAHPASSSQRKGIKAEVVNDLYSTAQKAMLTGYKMASTHVNLALDKLSAFEQAQAANLAANKPQQQPTPSAPQAQSTGGKISSAPLPKGAEFMGSPPSID